jgi:ATP-dependent exoDNAse (exonuclease V) alpha subunit
MIRELQEQTPMTILTPTHEAGQLYANLNIGYKTVAGFIIECAKTNKKSHELIVMDEVGMINHNDGHIVNMSAGKGVIIVGDKYQLPPVSGGSFIEKLPSDYNITNLTKNYRQNGDDEFVRKLSILRLNANTNEKFGTIIDEIKAVQICKDGGIIACQTNERVNHFNLLCNDGPDFKEGSRIRFNENRIKLGYHRGILGVVKQQDSKFVVITKKNTYDLNKVIEHIELAYAMTIHKLQGKSLTQPLIYDDRRPICSNIKYVAYSRVVKESNLYILK